MSVPVLERDEQQIARTTSASPAKSTNGGGRLPLHSGDRLTRLEFERRYEAYPDLKAELVEGVVVVSSPVHVRVHAEPHSLIMTWLTVYRGAMPGLRTADNATLRIDRENELQPDACMWIDGSGRAWIDKDDYLAGAPELIVEIAASSAAHDLHDKLRVYRRNGVQEYLVLVVYEQDVRWFNWQTGEDRMIAPDADGILRSQFFPGLWLDPARFWQNEVVGLLAILQQGLATPEQQPGSSTQVTLPT
jgi:Uma2 family endonuclease